MVRKYSFLIVNNFKSIIHIMFDYYCSKIQKIPYNKIELKKKAVKLHPLKFYFYLFILVYFCQF